MKSVKLFIPLIYAIHCQAQDSTLYNYGYSLEYDSIYVVVDTSNQVSYLYDHYTQPVRLQINDSKPFRFEGYIIVHYVNFQAVVSRNKWFKTYKI